MKNVVYIDVPLSLRDLKEPITLLS